MDLKKVFLYSTCFDPHHHGRQLRSWFWGAANCRVAPFGMGFDPEDLFEQPKGVKLGACAAPMFCLSRGFMLGDRAEVSGGLPSQPLGCLQLSVDVGRSVIFLFSTHQLDRTKPPRLSFSGDFEHTQGWGGGVVQLIIVGESGPLLGCEPGLRLYL